MKKGCIIQVDLPPNSPYGESYNIITLDGMTFEQFRKMCNQTNIIPKQDDFEGMIYIPLHEITRYYEVKDS
jgi:hypothetical protein